MSPPRDRVWKCLTVCQPWAWCIVYGSKRVENRSWRCRYRGPLLIHAGRSQARLTSGVYRHLARLGASPPPPRQLVYGAIIGVCRLEDCLPVEQLPADPWAGGPWCLQLTDVMPLPKPIPCPGRLKLFDANLTDQQHRQLKNILPQPRSTANNVSASPLGIQPGRTEKGCHPEWHFRRFVGLPRGLWDSTHER